MNRRRFILSMSAILIAGGYALSPLNPLRWRLFEGLPGRRGWLESRLRTALAEMLDGSAAPLEGITMDPAEAARKLVAGLSRREIRSLLASRDELRAHVDRLQHRDYEEDRTSFVDGWLLSETEICIAVLGQRSLAF